MREKKSGNRRIEFVAKTVEQKQQYEEKRVEMQFKSISDMIRFALDELIEGNDMSSPEVIRYIRGDSHHNIADRYDHLGWNEIVVEYIQTISSLISRQVRDHLDGKG